jgi:hypothetical protein
MYGRNASSGGWEEFTVQSPQARKRCCRLANPNTDVCSRAKEIGLLVMREWPLHDTCVGLAELYLRLVMLKRALNVFCLFLAKRATCDS